MTWTIDRYRGVRCFGIRTESHPDPDPDLLSSVFLATACGRLTANIEEDERGVSVLLRNKELSDQISVLQSSRVTMYYVHSTPWLVNPCHQNTTGSR